MRGDPKESVFCYLYEDFPRMYPFERVDSKSVAITLPHPSNTYCNDYTIPYDHRDQRSLIVFDGDIPWCGLPRAGNEQIAFHADTLISPPHQQRKEKEYELPAPYAIPENGPVELALMRRFILLPAGNALIMRYRQHSLAGWYAMVKIFRYADGLVEVDFLNNDC